MKLRRRIRSAERQYLMLHEISLSQLRVGMFVASFNCSWFSVPFWRKSLLINDQATIERIALSGIETLTIDDSRGVGPTAFVESTDAPSAAHQAEIVQAGHREPALERRKRPRTPGKITELDRARQTVQRSKAAVIDMFMHARLGRAVEVAALEPLVDEIAASVARDSTAIISVTRLKSKNEYTYLHSVAVCALMMNLARQIGMTTEEIRQAGLAGMLHDIGKTGISEALLEKPGALSDDERRAVQSHPEIGHALLCRSENVGAVALDVCLHHHERIDGRGYPYGFSGDQLSIFARMGAICDVYDAVTSVRPYKMPWSPSDALARMIAWEGHFDPRLLRAFITSLGIFPIGGLVRLRSNQLAIVTREDPDNPTTPLVRAFYDVERGCTVTIADVATGRGGDPIVQGENGEHWFGDEWPAVAARVREAEAPIIPRLASATGPSRSFGASRRLW
ncbi:HD-GYP domain-containing protein [Sphingomonas sp. TX0543]|uniref:HD-GYP domain-containing protein n=1 Tax=unclassified Sphingomonas TaxID=196159 RepID=UPI002016395D|nr:HD-GYP domain-containing protein [Sphingomonas sp. 3P27F8]